MHTGFFVGKPEGKRPLGRPWRRCYSKIKMNFKGMERESMYWIDLAQDMDVSLCCDRGRPNTAAVSINEGNFFASRATFSF